MRRSDLVFFLSGAAALVDEVVWSRLLARLLGSDAVGTGVVLAVFLGGLGVGALLLAGPARRARDPRRLFLALEVAVGLWAAASPFVLDALGPVETLGARLGLAVALLAVPTIAMGGTFPVMARLAIRSAAEAGADTSRFYGANTVGAAAGALLAPFVLMPAAGLAGTLLCSGALHLVAGALALALALPAGAAPAEETDAAGVRVPWSPLLLAPLFTGFASLAYEVAMVRVLVSLTGASVYAFAIVLAVYLLGLGLGSRQAAGWLEREGRGATVLFHAALLAPVGAFAGLLVLRLKVGQALDAPLENLVLHGAGALQLWISHALLAALALALPAAAFGAALPAAIAALLERDPAAPREPLLARAYAMNTLGSTLGALVGGFVLLPFGAGLAVRVGLAAALVAALPVARGRMSRFGALAAAAAGLSILALAGERPAVVAHEVGVQATASVTEARQGERVVRALRVNGKVVASTAPVDLRLQRLLGHVPGVVHGEVKSALVIGLGTGMTAGSLLDLPTLERLDVVEISSAVREAARSFGPWNGGLHDDPRTHLLVGDGRHYLLVSDERYDLVTSDPIHPWTRGSSDLYATEHFERMAAHLAPGGIASQWLPLYQLSDDDVRTVVASWCAAFPHVAAWLTAYDLALVGWNEAPPGYAGWAGRPLPPRVAAALAEAGVRDVLDLAALQVAGDAGLRAFAAGTEPMVENRPVLEFRAPKSFLAGYSVGALRWAGRPEYVDQLPEPARARATELRSALTRFLDRLPQGLSEAARLYGEELLAPR
ncbi:MAG: hypothetical protein AAF682_09570 [Planctomycetota bacterium]